MLAHMTRRRFAVLSSAAALAAGVAVAAPSHAAGPAACEFSGVTSSLTPIPVTGSNTGSYTFSGKANCVLANGSTVLNASVSSSGSYNNIQCGTGTATGSVSLTGVGSFSYTITFVGGNGTLQVTSAGDTGAGVVHITPQVGGCVTGPVTQFTVNGTVTGNIS